MTDKEKAFDIMAKKRVNINKLIHCFSLKEYASEIAINPSMRRGLFAYNNDSEPERCYEKLTLEEYLFLGKVLGYEIR